jgi:hypothetical protein
MSKVPVAFFGFNRPDCTRIVFEEIRRYRPERLLLVADGPRPAVPADIPRCAAVREIMQAVDWPCEVRTNFAEQNLGCRRRMSSGVDWVFSEAEEAILLEDDCVPAPDFFNYCAEMLARYRDNPQIMHIGGANFQDGHARGDGSYYFSRCVHVWGWASWRRAWCHYDVNMGSWPEAKHTRWLAQRPLSGFERRYWETVLGGSFRHEVNSWDYQWVYACWRQNALSVISNVNLITNIGAGPDATHTQGAPGSLALPGGALGAIKHPSKIEPDRAADDFTFEHHYGGRRMRRERHPVARAGRLLSKLGNAAKVALTRPGSRGGAGAGASISPLQ